MVACWPKELQNEIKKDNFSFQFTNCFLPSNTAKTSSLGINPQNYVNSLLIKKFKSIEFGSKRSNTVLYSCHTKFYFFSAVYFISFLLSFGLNQCANTDYTTKERKIKNEKILLFLNLCSVKNIPNQEGTSQCIGH